MLQRGWWGFQETISKTRCTCEMKTSVFHSPLEICEQRMCCFSLCPVEQSREIQRGKQGQREGQRQSSLRWQQTPVGQGGAAHESACWCSEMMTAWVCEAQHSGQGRRWHECALTSENTTVQTAYTETLILPGFERVSIWKLASQVVREVTMGRKLSGQL